jgi:hypothetical protein
MAARVVRSNHPGLRGFSARRGILLYMILFAFIVLIILSTQFHKLMRTGQVQAYRLEKGLLARQVAEAAMEEAFRRLTTALATSGDPMAAWIMSRDGSTRDIPLPLTRDAFNDLMAGVGAQAVKAGVQVLPRDFRGQDSRGAVYYGQEGVGSVLVTVDVNLGAAVGQGAGVCRMQRVHDYKVVCVRSMPPSAAGRNQYAQDFVLDYALLVRDGFEEFNRTEGRSLHSDQAKLTVNQDDITTPAQRGKVLIGGTGARTRTNVFLNIHEKLAAGLIPPPLQTEIRIEFDDVAKMYPKIAQEFSNISTPGVKEGLKGVFRIRHAPLMRDQWSGTAQDEEKTTLDRLFRQETGSGTIRQCSIEPLTGNGATIKITNAADVLEGDVRQRFLRFVEIVLEYTGPGSNDPQIQQELAKTRVPGITRVVEGALNSDQQAFVNGLAEIVRTKNLDVYSRLSAEYLYQAGLTGPPAAGCFPEVPFRNRSGQQVDVTTTGPAGVQPFYHINLWGRRAVSRADLEGLGIIDAANGVIRLDGVTWVYEPLAIGEPSRPWKIVGRGVLISDQDIIINGTIEKSAVGDFGVFFTRKGVISVNASKVEASLIALGGGSGRLIMRQGCKIRGAVAVDQLALEQWSAGAYEFTYDPILRSLGADLYAIHLSPAVTFQRVTEGS